MEHQKLLLFSNSMTVLKDISNTKIFCLIRKVLKSMEKSPEKFCKAYAALCNEIFEKGDLSKQFYNEIIYNNNLFAQMSRYNDYSQIPEQIRKAVEFDLTLIQKFANLDGTVLIEEACKIFPDYKEIFHKLVLFPVKEEFFIGSAEQLYSIYHQFGFGYFAKGKAFCIKNGKISLIEFPDETRLTDLKGYQRQKDAVLRNTISFLKGKQSNNILLYGDKGTGKSSTVKAVVNEFCDKGLKIIELKVNQIENFPMICQQVKESPFKFIIFLDDLSFDKEDEHFTALKAFIEGGIVEKPDNIVIYATSNRRHLIRESFSDRNTDEVHLRDTLETITSLSDRFGLEITFSVPGKDEYLYIVEQLAKEYHIPLEQQELFALAERFALRRNGRSPRTARQFIKDQLSMMESL